LVKKIEIANWSLPGDEPVPFELRYTLGYRDYHCRTADGGEKCSDCIQGEAERPVWKLLVVILAK
jgi:hypothetical protein